MQEKITLDMLTKDSVSVKKQKYTVIDGQTYEIGLPSRIAYVNSNLGRQQISQDLSGSYLTAVMSVWGTTPTMEDLPVNV